LLFIVKYLFDSAIEKLVVVGLCTVFFAGT